jgi:hypothetical protein
MFPAARCHYIYIYVYIPTTIGYNENCSKNLQLFMFPAASCHYIYVYIPTTIRYNENSFNHIRSLYLNRIIAHRGYK